MQEIMSKITNHHIIYESYEKANQVLHQYSNIAVSVSGGADSDLIVDICHNIDVHPHYIFFNTGIEYQATLDHLDYLEDRYKITIERINAPVPVPLGCQKYGLPFLNKQVSEALGSLYKHDFPFQDIPTENSPYPKSYMIWWNNEHTHEGYRNSRFNINSMRLLKEFLMENPPTFQISRRCCDGAKKNLSKQYIKENNIDLLVTGIRKSEGGVRAMTYKTCFLNKKDVDLYMPIFWYTEEDKQAYEEIFNIQHSRCYTEYGLKRTGCCGCPYDRDFEHTLEIIKEKEPKLYKAVTNIFGASYEYTRQYHQYITEHSGTK